MTKRTPGPNIGKPASKGRQTASAQRLSSQRAAAARERIAATQRRKRLWIVAGSVVGVLALVAALVIVKVATGAGGPKSGTKATTAAASVLNAVENVPASVLDTVGAGSATGGPKQISAPALTESGKPEVLYVGAEYCPYCAAERWAVAVALSRFGALHGVGETSSSPSDVYPSTQTLSFHGATYTSSVLAFTAKELQSNQVVDGKYATLDTLTAAQQAIVTKYNAPPYTTSNGAIPFVDIGGRYVISGASYDPGVLKGKTHAEIAQALSDPTSSIARAVDGTANLITAAVCASTNNQPSTVCSSSGVQAGAAALTKLAGTT